MAESLQISTSDPSLNADCLQTFLFEASHVRGEIVRIESAWKTIQARRAYPIAVKKHLGEMVAAGALLSATLKFDGTLILQAQGTGAVRLIVVECSADLSIRATIKLASDTEGEKISENATLCDLINPDGLGKLAITLDPANRQEGQQAYQGIVPLQNMDGSPVETIAQAMMVYMEQSEQLETRLWLASNDEFAAGMLLQRLPKVGGKISADTEKSPEEIEDAWARLQMLAETTGADELLSTPPTIMMNRLFQEESEWQTVRSFEPRAIRFNCPCSRHRVGNMLLMLGLEEVESILAEQGKIETECDFCGESYEFDAVDCKQLFVTGKTPEGMNNPNEKH
jgi:molecular chaperone Hsp33